MILDAGFSSSCYLRKSVQGVVLASVVSVIILSWCVVDAGRVWMGVVEGGQGGGGGGSGCWLFSFSFCLSWNVRRIGK